jgi:hypothetical protein
MRLELADVAIQFGGAVKSHAIGDVDHRLRRPNRIDAASAQLQLQGRGLQRALNLNSGGP